MSDQRSFAVPSENASAYWPGRLLDVGPPWDRVPCRVVSATVRRGIAWVVTEEVEE